MLHLIKNAANKLAILGTGFNFGLEDLAGLEFDINKPWRCCCICGAVYQSKADRTANSETEIWEAAQKRAIWAINHAKVHSLSQHRSLRRSGLICTPEAAHSLAAFGILPMSDMANSDEMSEALRESRAIPLNDSES